MTKSILMVTCALASLGVSTAYAQTVSEGGSVSAQPAENEFSEIIVTAQGRAQTLADVPVAISAVDSKNMELSGATDIREIGQLAPSLLLTSTASEAYGSPRIRGIGTIGDNPGLESSVVVLIDGVYRARAGNALNDLGEIERIEIQRGPQGTLGGRNSTAGLISVITKAPSFTFGGKAEATFGNYDLMRFSGSVTGPISDKIAARLDGVYVKRDGFFHDRTNDTTVNDRDRYVLRGQMLFEPDSDISIRLIGDYSKREEQCCGATYVDNTVNPYIGNLNTPATPLTSGLPNGNNIVNVIRDLGQNLAALTPGYSRDISVSPGRSYQGRTQDWGLSGQVDWQLGNVNFTSVTSYRDFYNEQGADIDYSVVDLYYFPADGNNRRQYRTFTQELRFNGSLFDDRLDWLVGGFYANEKYRGKSNLRFGSQYGRFANCRIISGGGLAGLYSPTSPGCVVPGAGLATLTAVAGADVAAGFVTLDGLNDMGANPDYYNQDSRTLAVFTHNIVHITPTVDLTLGLRYTDERKRFSATFGNDNTVCTSLQSTLTDDANAAGARGSLARALIGLGCVGNSSAELDGVNIRDKRSENEFTGTAVLSWKPIDDLLLYASYSKGYKAGGFNLDRSALKAVLQPDSTGSLTSTFAALGGAQALVQNLQFDPEKVNAFEIGAKYSTKAFSLSVSAFRQEFSNYQLNTFNGAVFIVANINGCTSDLMGADRDQDSFSGASNYNPAANSTGACNKDNVSYGVLSQGVELDASLVPAPYFRVSAGLTYASTKYRDNLVGDASGSALTPALRQLPGSQMSLAPEYVVSGSVTWTPPLGDSGLSGLVYVDTRMNSDMNTGSDLFPQKEQDGYAIVNARVGIRGPDEAWSVELWARNLFNKDYAQVVFNTPFHAGATTAAFQDPQYPGGRQIFSQYLADPRTWGVTLRGKF